MFFLSGRFLTVFLFVWSNKKEEPPYITYEDFKYKRPYSE